MFFLSDVWKGVYVWLIVFQWADVWNVRQSTALCLDGPRKKGLCRKTYRATDSFVFCQLIDEAIKAEFLRYTCGIRVGARWRLLNSSRIERLLWEETVNFTWRSWNRSRLNTIEGRCWGWVVFGIHEWILTVSILLCGVLCIVSNIQFTARTPITSRGRKVFLLIVVCIIVCKWQCFCVHPPIARLRIRIVTSVVRSTGVGGVTICVKGLLHELAVVGDEPLLMILILSQVTYISFDET